MRRLEPDDLREAKIFMYYRVVRGWASKTYELQTADVELLIYLDCRGRFRREDFDKGTIIYPWDSKRWEKLRREGWIDVWRHRNHTTRKYAIFQVSSKGKRMVTRMYRILLGSEDMPVSRTSAFYKNKTYTDKVYNRAIDEMIKDKEK